jgi:hypothetical protein
MKGISPKFTPVARLVYYIYNKDTLTLSEAQGNSR